MMARSGWGRRLLAAVALIVTMSGCTIGIDVSAVVSPEGSGTFRVSFAFDKEFVDVVSTSADGRRSLAALKDVVGATTTTGWTIRATQPSGGLRIQIDRTFDDPESLNRAIEQVASKPQQGSLAFLNIFRDFSLRHSGGFLKTTTDVAGNVDLAPERLAPSFAKVKPELRQALQQAAGRVFAFKVRVLLPGHVTRFSGDPEKVDGGVVEWSAPFGRTLTFSAHASGLRWGNVGLAALPFVLLLIVLLIWMRRRRRAAQAPVEGWEVTAPQPQPEEPTAPAEPSATAEPSAPAGITAITAITEPAEPSIKEEPWPSPDA